MSKSGLWVAIELRHGPKTLHFHSPAATIVNLVIIHYHLNRGGVTQVILNHLRALAVSPEAAQVEQVVLLYGGRRAEWPDSVFSKAPPFPLRLVEIEELEYDSLPVAAPVKLADRLRRALADAGATADNTVLHVHNHALGKNASLPGALAALAAEGYRQLLQVHDFVEDLRPDNYRHLAAALGTSDGAAIAAQLYPQAAGIHYAVLNRRDRLILRDAGAAAERLHFLPNPVAEFHDLPDYDTARADVLTRLGIDMEARLVVYPVRGIRRKNVGEMLLVSALDPRSATYAVTLAPLNPVELSSFQRWRRHAQSLQLACRFDLGGRGIPFPYSLAAADSLLTTSVAEGFGMVFLEAWLAGRMLIGRNLPEITVDFAEAGIRLDGLYDRLAVPLELVDEGVWRRDLKEVFARVCTDYRLPPASPTGVDRHLDELIADATVEFASLSPSIQAELIARVSRDPAVASALLDYNPQLELAWRVDSAVSGDTIRENAEAVRAEFSLEAIGSRLVAVYQAVGTGGAGGRVTSLPSGELILKRFLDVRRLHPLRVVVSSHA